ncbi:YceI family protein [Streptomyces sp. NBC_00557]|uniref:YceI family protein n=1 Tax=Streptomyces sp. NBC_00557 TaxID=2975776 RepID=UPI002E813280|nr:YceI family protein [Streptomyces sp. NBC_00557]WUC33672.1 YceI family protein [Streptomyces sp. NBC_00557]
MALGLLRRRRSRSAADAAPGLSIPLPAGAGAYGCEVVDPMGQPMGGAEITVTAVDSHRVVARGTTDPYGLFMATLSPGSYSVMATAEGLTPARKSVDIAAGVVLPPARISLLPARQLELPPPGSWLFDPPHTAIRFIAKHVGMAHVHGRFTRFDGGIRIGPDMADSQVSVRIDASSIATGNKTRDNHLRSADFLDVERYPYIDFTSTRFVYRGGSKWTLHGTLTMHGTSRSVALDTTYLGTVNGGYDQELRCAALAKTELHREDFTLNWRSMLARGIAVVGPTVQLELDVQAMYRTPETPTPPE